jgi:tRNA (guanine-N7-)-methyltransferase
MGRRSLPKIDPNVDLAGYFLEWESLPRPCTSQSLFGRDAPWEIEVGSGKGLFLAGASAARPGVDFLGIELAYKYARFAAYRLAKRGAGNVKVACADGLRVFHECVPDDVVTAVHVYFPDPWWKKRHKKRRVMNEAFLADVYRVLLPGGALHFWTDVQEYYETTLELIAAIARFEGPLSVEERAAEHDLDYRTHFERRTRLHELPVYRAEFRKPRVSGI